MALLLSFKPLFSCSPSPFSSSSYASSTLAFSATSISRFPTTGIDPQSKSFNGIRFLTPVIHSKNSQRLVKASSLDGTAPIDNGESASEEKKVVPVDKLPLETKTQQMLEQKAKMKLAKKIRLRRKRLVRKRRMRKKGRWPPSKMKKLKNV